MKITRRTSLPSSSLEPLEARIAPAVLIAPGGHVATYTDLDGDHVTVKITHGTLTAANFMTTNAFANVAGGERVQQLHLDASFSGTDLSIMATPFGGHGDGVANVGYLDALNVDLGRVTVDGDLGALIAGSGQGFALKSLQVQSFGELLYENGAKLDSLINGSVGTLSVHGSMHDGHVSIYNAAKTATLGALVVGHSVISSSVTADHGIGLVRIAGDLTSTTGISTIATQGNLPDVRIGGALDGALVLAGGRIGRVTVGHDMIGGNSVNMGAINAGPGGIGSVTIGGSLLGGIAPNTAAITTSGNIGSVSIGGDMAGMFGTPYGPVISASGLAAPKTQAQAVAIKSISIGGDFRYATLAAGVDANPDAGFGMISIRGDFYCSHIAAGTKSGFDQAAGTNDDTFLGGGTAGVVARIARLVIGGRAEGTYTGDQAFDSFRIMAEAVGSFSLGGHAQKLAPSAATIPFGTTNDLFLVKSI